MLLRGGMYEVYLTVHLHVNGGNWLREQDTSRARNARTRQSLVSGLLNKKINYNFFQNLSPPKMGQQVLKPKQIRYNHLNQWKHLSWEKMHDNKYSTNIKNIVSPSHIVYFSTSSIHLLQKYIVYPLILSFNVPL